MSIQINDNTIIDDNTNFSSVGIVTVGTGSSIISVESNSNFFVGVGVTLSGLDGNIAISGTITALNISLPLTLG